MRDVLAAAGAAPAAAVDASFAIVHLFMPSVGEKSLTGRNTDTATL